MIALVVGGLFTSKVAFLKCWYCAGEWRVQPRAEQSAEAAE